MSKLSVLDIEGVEGIAGEEDRLGGGSFVFDSGAYDFTIDIAYLFTSDKGAMGLGLHLTDIASGRSFKPNIYMTGNKEKGGKPFYIDKNTGEKRFLPGFNNANAIATMVTGKNIGKLNTEEKTIGLYSFEEKKEVPTKVDMIMELLNGKITLGLHKEVVDKTKLNPATKQYDPTGETREQNEIKKVFQFDTHLTMSELTEGKAKGEFYDQWVEQWAGKEINKAEGAKASGATAGAPAAGGGKPTESLFD